MGNMQEIKFNINDYARVKLTEEGKEILKQQYDGNLPSTVDEEGYYREQLWIIMRNFEGYLNLRHQPFETNIMLEKRL